MMDANGINQTPIYVINLDRSLQRLESIKAAFKFLKIEFIRIQAVDLNNGLADDISGLYDDYQNSKSYFARLTKAEQGCFHSHRKAWQAFLDSSFDTCIVLEDDVALADDFSGAISVCCDWLTNERPRILKLYAKRPVKGMSFFLRNGSRRIVVPKLPPLGAVAQIINRPAARELLANSDRFFQPVDVYMQASWQTGVEVGVLQPSIVKEVSAMLGGSTIQKRKRISALQRLKREVLRTIFRFKVYCKAYSRYRKQLKEGVLTQ